MKVFAYLACGALSVALLCVEVPKLKSDAAAGSMTLTESAEQAPVQKGMLNAQIAGLGGVL